MLMLNNVPWPQVKLMLLSGEEGVYTERDGWFSVAVPAAGIDCEFPDEREYDRLDPPVQAMYQRGWAEDFRKNYKAKLVRCSLSNENS